MDLLTQTQLLLLTWLQAIGWTVVNLLILLGLLWLVVVMWRALK